MFHSTQENKETIPPRPYDSKTGLVQTTQHPNFEYDFMNVKYNYYVQPMHLLENGNQKLSILRKFHNSMQELVNFEQYCKDTEKQDKVYQVEWNTILYLIYSFYYEANPFKKMFRLLQLIRIRTIDMYSRELASKSIWYPLQNINLCNYISKSLECLEELKRQYDVLLPKLESYFIYNSVLINLPNGRKFQVKFKPYLENCMSEFDELYRSMKALEHSNDDILKNYGLKESNRTLMKARYECCLQRTGTRVQKILKELPGSI